MARNIQREFVKYYKERLASLGFIKVKGRQPYFVRDRFQNNKENYEQGMQLLREYYDRNIEYLNGIGIAVERRDITDLFD